MSLNTNNNSSQFQFNTDFSEFPEPEIPANLRKLNEFTNGNIQSLIDGFEIEGREEEIVTAFKLATNIDGEIWLLKSQYDINKGQTSGLWSEEVRLTGFVDVELPEDQKVRRDRVNKLMGKIASDLGFDAALKLRAGQVVQFGSEEDEEYGTPSHTIELYKMGLNEDGEWDLFESHYGTTRGCFPTEWEAQGYNF